ncbi:MAG: endonuclease III [Methylococcales bacterium]|nr:endonuclease III [Methylococcaceae bacterium]
MNAAKRLAIFERLAQAIPDPQTELNYSTSFELLIAVVLSAQATDKGVNKATSLLFPVANTPESILALGERGLKEFIKTIGLFNSKAAHIITLCQQLLDKHQGQVPTTRAELEALAGVGRKTANVILNTAFGHAVIAVDTHIFRVANRTGLAPGKTVLDVERKLDKVVNEKYKKDAHHLLILHGRYTCIARKPRCPNCVVVDLCEFKDKQAT